MLKYFGVSVIFICLICWDDFWQFDYCDNGKGVGEEVVKNGFGFMIMWECMWVFNG